MQWKDTDTHTCTTRTHTVLKWRKWTDRLIAAMLINYWPRAERCHKEVKVFLLFICFHRVSCGLCLWRPEERMKEPESKVPCVVPTVYRAMKKKKKLKDPTTEEVVSHQHFILLLHDLLCKWTAHL